MSRAKMALAVVAGGICVSLPVAAQVTPRPAVVAGETATAPPPALSFGTFPSHSLVQLESFYAPLALYLSESTGRSVRFGTSSSYARFRDRLARSEFDFAFVQASDYTDHAFPQGYRPLLRARSAPLVFFVRTDSDVRTLDDLRGQTIALPPVEEDATSVALQRLREVGLQPGRDLSLVYLLQNNACLQYVLSGRSAAGAISLDALQFVAANPDVGYRVIDDAARVSPPLFIAAARVPAAYRRALVRALLAWPAAPAGQGSPVATGWMDLMAVRDGEYGSGPLPETIPARGVGVEASADPTPGRTRNSVPREGS